VRVHVYDRLKTGAVAGDLLDSVAEILSDEEDKSSRKVGNRFGERRLHLKDSAWLFLPCCPTRVPQKRIGLAGSGAGDYWHFDAVRGPSTPSVGGLFWPARVIDTRLSLAQIGEADAYR
jgi:hypothetical protein